MVVVFGGYASYNQDDLVKFLWFVRIAQSAFPDVVEADYYPPDGGAFGPGAGMSEKFKNSLAFKLMYYRFGEVQFHGTPPGYDGARQTELGEKDIHLKKFREVYTSRNWMVRIFEVLEPENRAPAYHDSSFDRSILHQPDPEWGADTKLENVGGVEYGTQFRPYL